MEDLKEARVELTGQPQGDNSECGAIRRWFERNKTQLTWSFISTFAFMIVAHSYRWVNGTSATHDGLLLVFTLEGEGAHQVSLGRFLYPVYAMLRGSIASPLFVGIMASVFIALSVFVVAKLLDIRHAPGIFGLAGALSTSITVTLLNATYTPWFDADMLALLLAVLGVYLTRRWRFGFLAGGMALMASMAIYQSYLQAFLGLALVALAIEALDGADLRQLCKHAGLYLAALAVGSVLYVIGMKAAMALFDVTANNDYNGIADVGNYEGISIADLILCAYILPIASLISPETHLSELAGALNVLGALATITSMAFIARQKQLRTSAVIFALLCVAVLPFGCDIVFVISRGMIHGLMIHAYAMLYVLAVAIAVRLVACAKATQPKPKSQKLARICSGVIAVGMTVVFACNAVYANQLYLHKDFEAQGTLSFMTRIVDRVEQMDGYVAGETPVVPVGDLYSSNLNVGRPGFPPEDKPMLFLWSIAWQTRGTGFHNTYGLTYHDLYDQYFRYVMGYPMNIVSAEEAAEYGALPEVQAMPEFPASGSIAWVGDAVVVKLS